MIQISNGALAESAQRAAAARREARCAGPSTVTSERRSFGSSSDGAILDSRLAVGDAVRIGTAAVARHTGRSTLDLRPSAVRVTNAGIGIAHRRARMPLQRDAILARGRDGAFSDAAVSVMQQDGNGARRDACALHPARGPSDRPSRAAGCVGRLTLQRGLGANVPGRRGQPRGGGCSPKGAALAQSVSARWKCSATSTGDRGGG